MLLILQTEEELNKLSTNANFTQLAKGLHLLKKGYEL